MAAMTAWIGIQMGLSRLRFDGGVRIYRMLGMCPARPSAIKPVARCLPGKHRFDIGGFHRG